jgi:prepilin-type N-terminal cleavage/methylation domain-containing protein
MIVPRRPQHGFTLLEILIVVTIIGILAALLLAGIAKIREQAENLENKRRIAFIEEQIHQYQAGDNQAYLVQKWGIGDDFRWAPMRVIFETLRDQFGYDLTTTCQSGSPAPRKRPGGVALDYSGTVTNYALEQRVRWGQRSNTTTYAWVEWSKIGEHIDRTFELVPTSDWPSGWDSSQYTTRWPVLKETVSGGVYTQTGWPASDWDQATPGSVIPKWEWPWGARIHTRVSGSQVDQIQARNLGQLSPLLTINLLHMAGVMQAADLAAAGTSYRTDRGTKRPWNDRWGKPMVVVTALFNVCRYDFQDAGTTPYPEITDQLLGARDLFLKRAVDAYGQSRAIYLAVGSIGPKLRTPLPTSWSQAQDNTTLRTNWLQIRENCNAAEWDENGFRKAPWSEVRMGYNASKTERSFLGTPFIIANK